MIPYVADFAPEIYHDQLDWVPGPFMAPEHTDSNIILNCISHFLYPPLCIEYKSLQSNYCLPVYPQV